MWRSGCSRPPWIRWAVFPTWRAARLEMTTLSDLSAPDRPGALQTRVVVRPRIDRPPRDFVAPPNVYRRQSPGWASSGATSGDRSLASGCTAPSSIDPESKEQVPTGSKFSVYSTSPHPRCVRADPPLTAGRPPARPTPPAGTRSGPARPRPALRDPTRSSGARVCPARRPR